MRTALVGKPGGAVDHPTGGLEFGADVSDLVGAALLAETRRTEGGRTPRTGGSPACSLSPGIIDTPQGRQEASTRASASTSWGTAVCSLLCAATDADASTSVRRLRRTVPREAGMLVFVGMVDRRRRAMRWWAGWTAVAGAGAARGVRWIGRRRPGAVVRNAPVRPATSVSTSASASASTVDGGAGQGHRPRRAPDPPRRWPVASPAGGGYRVARGRGRTAVVRAGTGGGLWSPCGRVRTTGAGRPSAGAAPAVVLVSGWRVDAPTGPAVPPCAARAYGAGGRGHGDG